MRERYTVLGASGFIGGALAATLRAAGHEVLTPPRRATPDPDLPLGHLIYCIGLTADFRTRPLDTVRAHVCVLLDWLGQARFESFLYLSSTRVYGRSPRGGESQALTVDPQDPSDLYDLSKLAGEAACLHSGREGVRVARLSNVVGPDLASDNFIVSLIREACAGEIRLRSDPDSQKDYVRLDDLLGLLPRLAARGRERIYNVASGHNLAHRLIVDRLAELTGCRVSVHPGAPLQRFPPIDIGRIRTEFDFRPGAVLDDLPELVRAYEGRDRASAPD